MLVLASESAGRGDLGSVENCCRKVIAIDPENKSALYNLGVALQQQGKTKAAISHYQKLIGLQDAHASAHANIGLLYRETGEINKAIEHMQQAIQLRPDNAAARNTMGLLHLDQKHYPDAISCFRQAIRLDRHYAQAHYNTGLALLHSGDPEGAAGYLREALRLAPDDTDTLNETGSTCKAMGDYANAMKYYDRAIDINPQHAEAHWNRSLILLLTGQFKQGWQEYEWRRETENRQRRNLPGTAWQGQPLKDCRILLYSEQGIGDTIQFIRYAAELKKLGAKVIVEIPGALLRIFNTCAGIDKIIPQGEKLPPFEFHASLMSLPRLLDTRNENIPVNIPYLGPAPENKTSIEKAFRSKNSGLRVGIAWGGNPEHPNDHNRSCPARYFSALGRIEGLQTFSLQKGPHQSELATITGTMPITDLSACLHDFADTANALAYLDLVITVDTSIAHLAGAMGSPVWLLLPFVPDWRWQLDREDSPWYPTMRLFRQHKRGEWEGVFNRVITALDELNNQD